MPLCVFVVLVYCVFHLLFCSIIPIVGAVYDLYSSFFSSLNDGDADYRALYNVLMCSAFIGAFLFSLLFGLASSSLIAGLISFFVSFLIEPCLIDFIFDKFNVNLSNKLIR